MDRKQQNLFDDDDDGGGGGGGGGGCGGWSKNPTIGTRETSTTLFDKGDYLNVGSMAWKAEALR